MTLEQIGGAGLTLLFLADIFLNVLDARIGTALLVAGNNLSIVRSGDDAPHSAGTRPAQSPRAATLEASFAVAVATLRRAGIEAQSDALLCRTTPPPGADRAPRRAVPRLPPRRDRAERAFLEQGGSIRSWHR